MDGSWRSAKIRMLGQGVWCESRSASHAFINDNSAVSLVRAFTITKLSLKWLFLFWSLYYFDCAHLNKLILLILFIKMRAGNHLRHHEEQHGCIFWDTITKNVYGQCQHKNPLNRVRMMHLVMHLLIHVHISTHGRQMKTERVMLTTRRRTLCELENSYDGEC